MLARIQKWGNSLAVRIPKAFAKEMNVSDGGAVNMTIDDGKIVISPEIEQVYRLDDLLEEITSENLHAEVESGEVVGQEIW